MHELFIFVETHIFHLALEPWEITAIQTKSALWLTPRYANDKLSDRLRGLTENQGFQPT